MVEEEFARWSKGATRCLDLGKLPVSAGAKLMEAVGIVGQPATAANATHGSGEASSSAEATGDSALTEGPVVLDRKTVLQLCSVSDEPRMPPLAPPAMKMKIDVLSCTRLQTLPALVPPPTHRLGPTVTLRSDLAHNMTVASFVRLDAHRRYQRG